MTFDFKACLNLSKVNIGVVKFSKRTISELARSVQSPSGRSESQTDMQLVSLSQAAETVSEKSVENL